MADEFIIKAEGLDEMINAFEDMSKPGIPKKSGERIRVVFDAASEAVRAHIHVETGYLKASESAEVHTVGDLWVGEISAARNPGVFELARGPRMTRNGKTDHFFLNAVEPFIDPLENEINNVFNGYIGEKLP